MVRIPAVLICVILIPGAASAVPRPSAARLSSVLIQVEESGPFWVSPEGSQPRSLAADCQSYDLHEAPAACLAYWRRLEELDRERQEKHAAPLVRAKPEHNQREHVKQINNRSANRALSEHERNAVAPRPLTPAAFAAPAKTAVPGKSFDERLQRMVGQLLLTGFSGREPGDPDAERVANELRDGKVSGVIVRDSNIESVAQLRRLLAALNGADAESPPLVAIEQAGGPDSVLSEDKGFAFYNSANAISSSASPYEAQLQYREMAGELAALGITLNIGPSEDTCREDGINLSAYCFGTSPSVIAAYARAFNFAHHDRGVLTALRHVPFRAGLRTSWLSERASSAMLQLLVRGETSDALLISVKAMDPLPFTEVSFRGAKMGRLHGIRSFGFRGALIFEMDMGPSRAPMLYGEAIARALQAGADMILVREPATLPSNFSALSVNAVQAGLKSGRLQLARIEDAYRHVQALKARLRSFPARTKIAGLGRDPSPRPPGGVE